MNQIPGVFIAIAPLDAGRPDLADLPLPVATLGLAEDGAPVAQLGDTAIPAPVAYASMVGLLSLSDAAAAQADTLADGWKAHFGTAVPARLDLSQVGGATRAAVSEWVIGALAEGRSMQAARNVQLQRDLGELRAAHEATQTAFQRLETFVYDLGGPKRNLAFQLQPFSHRAPLTLQNRDRVEQRLPLSSAGLSDVAFWISERPQDPEGRLEVSLELMETGEVASQWDLPADQIGEGWHRLSRGIALGTDRQSVTLRIRWHGAQPLKLAQTMRQPDPRFCASRNSVPQQATLAVAGWTCVAGASLPLPSGAWIDEVVYPRRWIVPTETMRAAEADGPEGHVAYSDELGGLMVTPGSTGAAIARLAGAAVPGMQQIFCGVETKSDAGPTVEYALAVVPSEPGRRAPGADPDLSSADRTDWIALPAAHWAEIQLLLPSPIDTVCDIYVLTRIATPPDGGAAPDIPADMRCCVFSIRANA